MIFFSFNGVIEINLNDKYKLDGISTVVLYKMIHIIQSACSMNTEGKYHMHTVSMLLIYQTFPPNWMKQEKNSFEFVFGNILRNVLLHHIWSSDVLACVCAMIFKISHCVLLNRSCEKKRTTTTKSASMPKIKYSNMMLILIND